MGRPVRGSREFAFYSVPQIPSLSSLDSAFQLQEYISLLVRLDPHDVNRIVALPGKDHLDQDSKRDVTEDEHERPIVDEACWIYEQLRRLAQDLTHPLITTLQLECTRQTCPEMKAGEWLYLCVAHGNTGGMEHCCAIDYIVHTLDSATALLNSPRAFPSRISIPPTSHRHFSSLARRLGRIFAHAYYHHRAAFESAEAENALYSRFLALSRRFDLVPAEFLVIPSSPTTGTTTTTRAEDSPHTRIALLTQDDLEPAASPAASSSPRIGGRARTGTMYLSGDFAVGGSSPSSSVSSSLGSSPGHTPLPPVSDDIVFADDGGGDEGDGDGDEEVLGLMPKVLVRDFALPPEVMLPDQVPQQQQQQQQPPPPSTLPLPSMGLGMSHGDESREEDAVEMEEEEEEEEEEEQEQEEEEDGNPAVHVGQNPPGEILVEQHVETLSERTEGAEQEAVLEQSEPEPEPEPQPEPQPDADQPYPTEAQAADANPPEPAPADTKPPTPTPPPATALVDLVPEPASNPGVDEVNEEAEGKAAAEDEAGNEDEATKPAATLDDTEPATNTTTTTTATTSTTTTATTEREGSTREDEPTTTSDNLK